MIDARRGEVFAAAYRGGETVLEPAALAPAALAERLLALDGPCRPSGTGRYASVRSSKVPESPSRRTAPPSTAIGAGPLCRLGAVGEPAERDALLPDYRREPDAKPPTR